MPSDPLKPFIEIPEYANLTLRQLYWLTQMEEHGGPEEMASRFAKGSSTIKRDLEGLADAVKLGSPKDFYRIVDKRAKLTEDGRRLAETFAPLLSTIEKLRRKNRRGGRLVTVGAGESLLSWLLGSRIEEMRTIFLESKFGEELPSSVSFECSAMTNRDALVWVNSSALDFALVRSSLVNQTVKPERKDVNGALLQRGLGEIRYGMMIPNKIAEKYSEHFHSDGSLSIEGQDRIFKEQNFVSVGPDGEFAVQLNWVLRGNGLDPKIEFNHHGFPQAIPHLLKGTHVAFGPIISQWGCSIPDCRIAYIPVLARYRRHVSLIWRKGNLTDEEVEGLVRILSF